MLSGVNSPINRFRSQLSLLNLSRISLDSAIAILSLLALIAMFDDAFEGRHLIFILIVFFLTFPGNTPTSTSPYGLFREIVGNWFAIFFTSVPTLF